MSQQERLTPLTRAHFLAGSAAAAATAGTSGPSEAKPFYVLVLSGGGAYGAYEAGVLSALGGLGIAYDVVCGTSIGALNGAMYASGQHARLVELWRHLSTRSVVALPSDLEPTASTALLSRLFVAPHRVIQTALGRVQGFYAAQPVRDILSQLLVAADGKGIVPFERPFFWAVTDLSDVCGTYYFHPAQRSVGEAATVRAAFGRRGARLRTIDPTRPKEFVEALRASTAIPALFEPALIGSKVFVDGGVVNNTPYDVAKIARGVFAARRPLEIHAVFNAPSERSVKPAAVRNGLGIVFACYDAMQKRLVDDAARLTIREAALAARIAPSGIAENDERLREAREVTIRVVRPKRELDGSTLDFKDQQAIDRNFARGAEDIAKGWQTYAIPGDFCALGPA